jgi:hypothetical protein
VLQTVRRSLSNRPLLRVTQTCLACSKFDERIGDLSLIENSY